MTELTDRHELVVRGRRAQEILEDPVFQDAMALVRASYIDAWLGTNDPQEQYAAWAAVKAIDSGGLGLGLRTFVSRGEYAAEELRREADQK